jgi:hypothetical protein
MLFAALATQYGLSATSHVQCAHLSGWFAMKVHLCAKKTRING